MKVADLAIITPTLNEANYIGKLLDSIITQSIQPKNIIIVDAFSTDNTIEEIKKYQKKLPQLKYYQIPKDTISKQRNLGAKKTNAKHLLFLDADMQLLDPLTLEIYLKEVETKKPDIAAATNHPDTDYWKDKGFFKAMDVTFKALKPIWPAAQGMNLYVKHTIFDRFGGFDSEIKCGEDHEFVSRVVKNGGKLLYLKRPKLYTSVRRIKKVGHFKFATSMTISFILDHTIGYKRNPLAKKYEFGNYSA
jgi:glycosyltransferase involved in cell wall biosynthesis